MRELLSLSTLKFLGAVTGLVAVVCVAVSLPLLARASSDLGHTVDKQDRELDCRAQDAAELDVLRSQISLELSRGLVQVVREDEVALTATIERIELLQVALGEATERRRQTVERCQRVN